MESYKSDQSDVMDRLLRKQLSSSGAQQCGGFDPDLANAYFEKVLSGPEEQAYQLHLSECRSCRKLYTEFFLFASESEPESATESAAAQTFDIPLKIQAPEQKPFFSLDSLRAWLFGPQLRWVLPGALVFIVAGTIWFSMNKPMSAGKPHLEAPAPQIAQSKSESESKNVDALPSDIGSNAAAPAPLSVQPKSEPNNVKTLPSGGAQSDAGAESAIQQPSNVTRQFERGSLAPQNEPARSEAETARRKAEARNGTANVEEVPADLAAGRNSFSERGRASEQSKDQSAAARMPAAAGAIQSSRPPAPAEPSKEALKPGAPSAPSVVTGENKASSSIRGFILDGDGKIVPGAQLILRNSATGAQRYANADNDGSFSFTGLPSGNYLVQAQTETLRKEKSVSLENAQNINNFRMQFDAPSQIAINAEDLKKKTVERDKLQREESAKQEKAKDKDQKVAAGEKADEKQKKAPTALQKKESSDNSGAGARANKDSEKESGDFVIVDDRWRIDGATGPAKTPEKAPAKADKQSRPKTGYKSSQPPAAKGGLIIVETDAAAPPVKTRRVGNKHFVFAESIWTDEEYLLKEKIKDLRVVKLEYKSEAYNKILNELPALKPFFQLGEQVIVVYKDAVYVVVKKL